MGSYCAHSNARDFGLVSGGDHQNDSLSFDESDKSKHATKDLNQSSTSLKYDLTAVIVHHGTAYSGHFFAYRRLGPDFWVKASDSVVEQVPIKTVLEAEAYMLFYAQCK